jgi:hypothetical protein
VPKVWPNEGIGLVLMFLMESGGRDVEFAEMGMIGFLDTICREYLG